MTRLKLPSRGERRIIALSGWLYNFFLRAYPATFRRAYGSRMARVFRDSCRDVLLQRGMATLIPFWLHTLSDLFITVCLEQWHVLKERTGSMMASNGLRNVPLRLWIVLIATIIAFTVSLVASLNLYLIEDASPLTQVAYAISPLLRFSYDVIYLSALAAGVAMCAIVGYALVRRTALVISGLIAVTLLIAAGGFGGLLIRHPVNFLVLFVIFIVITCISLLIGRGVAKRMAHFLGQRLAAILGACVSVISLLLINVIALVLHTLLLNPVSHALYMQGRIGDTHLNFSLIAMGTAFLTLIACIVSLGLALRLPSHGS